MRELHPWAPTKKMTHRITRRLRLIRRCADYARANPAISILNGSRLAAGESSVHSQMLGSSDGRCMPLGWQAANSGCQVHLEFSSLAASSRDCMTSMVQISELCGSVM